jgi:predicted cupin superfamily sugar epimerase
MSLTADDIRRLLRLEPLPEEGGLFREIYRAALMLSASVLPPWYRGERNASTAIYYLLSPGEFSALHRVRGDEVFHFYLGGPVEMLQLFPNGTSRVVVIGTDIQSGMQPQVVVPGGVWQGCRLLDGGQFALMGTTMSPGFDVRDFESGDRAVLIDRYPQQREMITALTRTNET